jgi:predicted secreted protein
MKKLRTAMLAITVVMRASAAIAQDGADFTERDDGREVRLFSPRFTVDLPRNTGTGYHWEIGKRDSRNVVLLAQSTRTPSHQPGVVGFGQIDRFTVRTTGTEGELRIGLLPPGSGQPQRVWSITFHSAYSERQQPNRYYSVPPPLGR